MEKRGEMEAYYLSVSLCHNMLSRVTFMFHYFTQMTLS